MIDRNRDSRRRRMPFDDWPAADRDSWFEATKAGGLLDGSGPAAHWRPSTRRKVTGAYGHFLMFLDRHGWLDRSTGPRSHVTPEWLRAYVEELSETVAPITLAGRLTDLREAFRVMAPDVGFPFLNNAQRRLTSRARPVRDKKKRVVPSHRLFELGLRLIAQAETGQFAREVWRAALYRDGLIILLLTCRPIRRSNLTNMRLDQNLKKIEDTYLLAFEGAQMKGRRSYHAKLGPALTPYLDRYLAHYRPILLGHHNSDFVWITWLGQRLAPDSLYANICEHTKKEFGHAIGPHLFRDCAMTTIANERPEQILIGMVVLHHADPRISVTAYNQAQDSDAILQFQDMISRRRRAAGAAKRRR
jgi:site-specific recombinase XerD